MTVVSENDHKTVANVFPLGMQNSSLTLYDDEGNSVEGVEDLSCDSNEQAIIPSAINVESSSDVIVGPVTQFHGPVTIYQQVNGRTQSLTNRDEPSSENIQNGTLPKSEKTSHDNEKNHSEKLNKSDFKFFKRLKYVLGIAITLMMLVSLTVTALILFSKSEESDSDLSNWKDLPGKTEENVTSGFLGPGAIINRATWGGKPPLSKIKLKHPTAYVIISHTATPFCTTVKTCSARVLSIQEYHVGTGKSPDIGYNFLIGGDGNAYVGRGWDVKNFHNYNSIGISFIGNYIYDNLTSEMIEIVQRLLAEGVVNGKLSEDYTIVAHNQTFATESPGPHVYDVISRWSHFRPGRVNIQ